MVEQTRVNPIHKYVYMAKTSVQDAVAYAINFIGRSVFLILIITMMLFLWSTIYGQGATTEGYDLNRMIWYLIIGELIALSSVNFFQEVSTDVKSGNIAYNLNKPYNYVLYQFANYVGKTGLHFVINLLIIIPIGLIYVGIPANFTWWIIPIALLVISLGMMLDFYINMMLALTAFWVEENLPFRWIYQKLVFTLGGMLLPIDLLPEQLGQVSRYLPFAFVTYFPATIITDFDLKRFVTLLLIQVLYIILGILGAFMIYHKGTKQLHVNGG